MSFNHDYQSELTTLRQLGKRFAERSPALAPFLGQSGRDPDVEQLLEGFAFLTGRLRQKLGNLTSEQLKSVIGAYNGSGPLAEKYARDAMGLLERAKSGAASLYFYER